MKSINKVILSIVALLPFSAVANAAISKMDQVSGEEQAQLLLGSINQSRRLLFPKGVSMISVDEMYEHVAKEKNLTDEGEISSEVHKNLEILINNGVVTVKDGMILASNISFAGNG